MKKGIPARFLLTCREATESVERQHHGNLSWWKSLQLQAHLKICTACLRYADQSRLLESLIQQKWKEASPDFSEAELESLKARILELTRGKDT